MIEHKTNNKFFPSVNLAAKKLAKHHEFHTHKALGQCFSTGVSKCATNFFVLTFTTLLGTIGRLFFVNLSLFLCFLLISGISVPSNFFSSLVLREPKKVENHCSRVSCKKEVCDHSTLVPKTIIMLEQTPKNITAVCKSKYSFFPTLS